MRPGGAVSVNAVSFFLIFCLLVLWSCLAPIGPSGRTPCSARRRNLSVSEQLRARLQGD